ncbi:N-6 DNA methylase [Coraliomargarita sp. SDUM461003]|uniref:N-6 DNA methylase n=1 Tax=Thalassobacterium maritimum TaxID=3041265 RepID=A0ABU1AVS2_9BACT|nr:N-6 DNA methylase [Coraliomargarita sp. SDUM461003]MDQ8208173.1 N-6 DNA methylase [Coraliomargarita sp. SDUM461003]
MPAKKDLNKQESFGENLWDVANKLRGTVEYSEDKHVILGEVPSDTFFKDQHPDLKADFIMANPPFNLKDWRGPNELTDDPRWGGYETPPAGIANYGWILHMVSKLYKHFEDILTLVGGKFRRTHLLTPKLAS